MLRLSCYHSFWEHGLNHFVHVVMRFEVVTSHNTIIVDQLRLTLSYFILGARLLFRSLLALNTLLLWCHIWFALWIIWNCPIKTDITSSLMSELKGTLGILLGHSSENEQSFFRFSKELRLFSYKWSWNINFSLWVDLYNFKIKQLLYWNDSNIREKINYLGKKRRLTLFHVLIEHNITDIFNIVKILAL